MEKQFLTTKEVAELLNLSTLTVKLMANGKKIPAFKIGGHWRFDKNEVIDWVKAGKAAKEDK